MCFYLYLFPVDEITVFHDAIRILYSNWIFHTKQLIMNNGERQMLIWFKPLYKDKKNIQEPIFTPDYLKFIAIPDRIFHLSHSKHSHFFIQCIFVYSYRFTSSSNGLANTLLFLWTDVWNGWPTGNLTFLQFQQSSIPDIPSA